MLDRKDVQDNHFLSLTNFGDHALHHLFPTLDHGVLNKLYPLFEETCAEFKVDYRTDYFPKLIVGQHMQLARTEPSDRCVNVAKTLKKES